MAECYVCGVCMRAGGRGVLSSLMGIYLLYIARMMCDFRRFYGAWILRMWNESVPFLTTDCLGRHYRISDGDSCGISMFVEVRNPLAVRNQRLFLAAPAILALLCQILAEVHDRSYLESRCVAV